MSDDQVRALARAAASAPHDVEAGRALARALARVGEREAARRELTRLARLGDLESLEALDALAPWPSRTGIGRTRRSTCASIHTPGPPRRIAFEHGVWLGAATREVALLETVDGLAGLGLDDLERRWLVDPQGEGACALGDDVLVPTDDGLLVVAGATGAPKGTIRSGDGRRLDELLVLGPDVVLVLLGAPDLPRVRALVGVDVAAGVVRWRRELRDYHSHNPAGPWLVLDLDEGAEVLRADTGEVVARRREDLGILLAADARGIVSWDRTRGLAEHALPALGERWRRPSAPSFDRKALAIGEELVLHAEVRPGLPATGRGVGGSGIDPKSALVAIERSTGLERWAVPLHDQAVVSLTPDAAYVLDVEVVFTGGQGMAVEGGPRSLPRDLHPRVAVRALELASGATRFDVEVDRAWDPELDLVPFERGLLVRVGTNTLVALREA